MYLVINLRGIGRLSVIWRTRCALREMRQLMHRKATENWRDIASLSLPTVKNVARSDYPDC